MSLRLDNDSQQPCPCERCPYIAACAKAVTETHTHTRTHSQQKRILNARTRFSLDSFLLISYMRYRTSDVIVFGIFVATNSCANDNFLNNAAPPAELSSGIRVGCTAVHSVT